SLTQQGVKRPMLVTDQGLVAAGIVATVTAAAGEAGFAAVFDQTPPNPDEDSVTAATKVFKDHDCDGVVGLGGGSSMDLAKAVALMASHEGPLEKYGASVRGMRLITKTCPIIAIPTTSGTGSEVSVGAVVVLNNGRKETFVSPHLIPGVAICDPDLTLGLPAGLTAATGMDAVTHCIEAILVPTVNPPLEAIAYDGVERAVGMGWLEKAVADGSDREARWHMMMASVEGALAFAKGLGAVHALSHSCGRLPGLKLHHGALNALFLPAVLRFSEGAAPEKYARLKRVMGLAPTDDLADAIAALNARLGIVPKLSSLGVTREMFPEIVSYALGDLAHLSALKRPTAEEYEALIEAVF
ncbi:MAG: iron-containing alcohol dehydrogenase, partial [Caulobacteraceae bacterium]|nr:iron-containing alcohol dehydrogenase [Caulobacteraceae bacterium]